MTGRPRRSLADAYLLERPTAAAPRGAAAVVVPETAVVTMAAVAAVVVASSAAARVPSIAFRVAADAQSPAAISASGARRARIAPR
ncbi:hypothetical protein [Micromonospora sp. NPDC023814]|uniref:hypothetical protein n=1 Tax=Micromonospora sp. NPDC023814 TaxID=3154596 RepID=UPI0033DFE478